MTTKSKKADENNEEEEEEQQEPWTPDQPIPEEEGETEAQRRHMLQRRLNYLNAQAEEAEKKGGKKKKKEGDDKGSKPWVVG